MARYKQTDDQKLTRAQRELKEQEELKELFESGKLFQSVDESKNANVPHSYWGNWIVKNTIILQSGVGGVSKTSLNYSLFMSLQRNGEFLDVVGEKTLKVLYFDYEGSLPINKGRLGLLGEDQYDHPYFFVCTLGITLDKMVPYVDKFIEERWKPDIIVLDPFSLAFKTENENDNAEATEKMKYVRDLMKRWDTTIILVHHSSKADVWGVGNARGAGSQGNLADIVWEYHPLPKEFDDNLFVLRIPKNREFSDGFIQCIQKSEGQFLPADFPVGFNKDTLKSTGIETYRMQQRIELIMRDGKEKSVEEIKEELSVRFNIEIARGSIEERNLFRSITPLLQKDLIMRIGKGVYVATSLLK
jgi:hypothetical protein